jgi:RHS repeat-associated protein
MQPKKLNSWVGSFFRRQLLTVAILGLAAPFVCSGSGVVSTASLAAFNSALAGGGTVTLAFDGTIILTNVETIATNTVVDGTGFNATISGANIVQVFSVSNGVNLTLNSLTIADGFAKTNGGAIFNNGILNANYCTFSGNNAVGTNGAAGITHPYNNTGVGQNGGNGASGDNAYGGAIYNNGTAALTGCLFEYNSATGGNGGDGGTGAGGVGGGGGGGHGGNAGDGRGGAVFGIDNLFVTNCTFSQNTASGGNSGIGGGAVQWPGAPAPGAAGGQGLGAGIYAYNHSFIYGSTFQYNSSQGGTGGAGQGDKVQGGSGGTTPGQKGGKSLGGGLCNFGTNVTINSTFYNDTATGGGGGPGGCGSPEGDGGPGGDSFGGGIYNSNVVCVTNSTISSCNAYGGPGYTGLPLCNAGNLGAKGAFHGGNIANQGTFILKNSILAYSTASTNAYGTITDAGNNISSDKSVPLNGSGSHTNTNPQLAALANNGRSTETCALLPGSPAIDAGDDTAAPTMDQRGYPRIGTSDIGSFEYGSWIPFVEASGSTASLDGNVGLFVIGGPLQPVSSPYTVNFTISGSASNGVDYAYITNSAVIPTGSQNTRILVRGIPGAFAGTPKSLTLTLASGTNYQITPQDTFITGTVTIYDHNTYDSTKRYVRGTSTAADFQSFVVPIDSETGVPLADIGGNATNLFPANLWTNTLYHFNATNLALQTGTTGRIPFQNPIVAFGNPVGGSPLYLNQSYSFGIASGAPNSLSNSLRINVYFRSNSAYAGTISMPIPNIYNTNQLNNLVTNGFTQTFTGFGLQTTMLVPSILNWGLQVGNYYILKQTASAAATNYFYEVEYSGSAHYNSLVLNQSGATDWSRMYVMEFSPYPAGLSTFINEPHFDSVPMPSTYLGASLQEMTNAPVALPDLSYLTPSNYLTLDASPELRRHPILDQFVSNMGNDPLALANYVINEIGLVDAVDYNTNYAAQTTINLGGVNRSALDTFQEGQGSPMEQCALLVYLLRQAGVPATYVFPTNGGMQMLSSQMSKLLHVQLSGAVNELGQTNVSAVLNVNYPWVAAYIGTNWVQIFPWIKDTEITEGFNLYDYMPTNYNSGYKWLTHFIANDTNIFSLSQSDQPLVLLPAFIQNTLNANYPGMSLSDLGMQIQDRRHLYSQWSDFPVPFALSGTPTVVESLSTNLNLFNTLEVMVYSQANPSRLLDSGEMYLADLHNRMLLLKFQQIGTNNFHNMIMSLEPYSANYTNVTTFGSSANPCWKLVQTNQLDSTDDNIVFQVMHRRSRFLSASFGAPTDPATNVLGYNYFEVGQQSGGQTYQMTDTFRKGDLIAFCFNLGNVSQKMLNVHAQQIWQFNQNANTNQPSTLDSDIYLGETTYLMGMSYFSYVDQFVDLASRLHKVTLMSWYQQGYGLLRPLRDGSGNLINGGNVIPVTPAVHMPYNGLASIFNGSTMANSGRDFYSTTLDWFLQIGLQGSCAEHGTLRSFYVTNAISTTKLLQQVGTNAIILNRDNYLAAGQISYNGIPLMNADPNVWASIANFFASGDFNEEVIMTPGSVTNGTYTGVAAMLISDNEFSAIVGGLNGGFANSFPSSTFSSQNSPNITVSPTPVGSPTPFYLTSVPNVNNPSYLVNGATTTWTQSATDTSLGNGQEALDPSWIQTTAQLSALVGSQQNAAGDYTLMYNNGVISTVIVPYNDASQRLADPVNMMTGEFYIDAADITLPGPMSLQIRRNYGSQNLAENEFGFGWKMDYVPFLSVGTNSTLIYAAEMDGSVVAYRQTSNTNLWLPQPKDNPMLNNNSTASIGSVGNLFNNRLQRSNSGGTNTFILTGADGSIRSFTQRSYPIGTFQRQRPYLDTWRDNNGNFYTFKFGTNSTQSDYGEVNRIQSSNGNFVWFEYDVYGHITAAHTGDGRILYYVYDQYGDLTSVTLPDQMEIDYLYQHANEVTNGVTNVYSTHLIVKEDKPDGRVLQNIYDSQRRVTNQLSTAGASLTPIRTATFAYTNNFSLNSPTNLLTGATVISDYFNHATTYYYTNSLVRRIVYPLNQTIVQNWYETNSVGGFQRSLKLVTDTRGLQTAYLYDSFGNLTNAIVTGDITGDGITSQTATNSASYNTNNLPVQITDAVGNSQVLVYDPTFNFLPQQIIRYSGATPVTTNFMVYANATNVVMLGNTTQTNVVFGVLTRQIRAFDSSDAATNDLFYNGQGFPTETIRYTGTSDPNLTNYLFYNERGLMVNSTDTVGAVTYFDYDPMNRPTVRQKVDEFSNTLSQTTVYYNGNGETNWTDGPQYNPDNYNYFDYDGMGRLTTKIHWRSEANSSGTGVEQPSGYNLYAQTFYQYDPLGNMLLIIDPRGAMTTNNYDALCRLIQSTRLDTDGTTVLSKDGYSYEPGGEVQTHTNALGGVTTIYYNMMGSPEYRINPDGSTNGWRYYLDGRIFKQIQSNGAYWQTTYNDANRTATRVFYSSTGVSEATNSVLVDRRWNTIQTQDAGFNVFNSTYDGLDRIKSTAGPVVTNITETGMSPGSLTYVTNVTQRSVGYFYDAAGRFVTTSNALGQLTVNQFDAIGRPLSTKNYNPGGGLVRQTYVGYSANNNSVTVTNGSGSDAIVNSTWIDTDGHAVLSIAYPSSGTTEFTQNQYDLAGNLVLSGHNSSSSGLVTTWTSSSSTFDGLNRRTSTTDRDNAVTYYKYDPLNDLTNRTIPGGSQWQATYNSAGQIQQEQDFASGNVVRTTSYNYYAAGSPFAGSLHTKTDARGTTCTYLYDDWLRTTNATCTGTLPEQNLTTTWQFEPRGNLDGISEQFANTNTGPPMSIQRSYDAYGELASESISDGSFSYGASQSWDVTGRRSMLVIGNNDYSFGYQGDGNMISAGEGGTGAYSYSTAGILTNRLVGVRNTGITSLDGEGRPLTVGTMINGESMAETLSYSGDGLLQSDTLYRPDFTDSRSYAYASLSRRLTCEQLNLNGSTTWTNNFTYDNGTSAGPGALTQMGAINSSSALWNAGVDAFSRINSETNNMFTCPAYGHVNGQATLGAWLDGYPISIISLGTNAMQWAATMELNLGTHQLTVAALHPSGQFTAWATNYFTNSLAFQQTADSYDANGDITNRVWKTPSGIVERTQSLSWDARGRLHTITQRDAGNSGYNWTAVYDPFNRRISTTTILVTNGVVYPASVQTIDSYFDPQVEFLELGVSYGTKTEWKLYGPDINGQYGGMNGVGALDGVSPGLSLFNPAVSDVGGNVLAYYDSSIGTVTWNAARPTGYGAVPNYRPLALADGATLAQSSVWRGHWVDISGYYNIGMRPYDPISGRWLTYDSLWNARDPNYYTFCGGDPINRFDPDGRFSNEFYNFENNGGVEGYVYNGIGSALNNLANLTENPYLSIPAAAGGQLFNEFGAMSAPSTYINGLSSFGNNISSYYQNGDKLAAIGYALTSWNVGAMYSGAANYDLTYNNAGGQIGDVYQRGAVFSGGLGSTAGLAAGGLGLWNLATAPATANAALAAEGGVTLTQEGIDAVGSHLSQFDEFAPNTQMVQRLQSSFDAGQNVTGADANFFLHETSEANFMSQGLDYDAAHAASLELHGASPFSLYAPEVIDANPTLFNNAWRQAAGLAPHQ